nr:hypothetical protein [Tanacetum cinerariifolium]
MEILLEPTSNKLMVDSWFLFVAGKGGRGSWGSCGGSGIEGKMGEVVLSSWRENRACLGSLSLTQSPNSLVLGEGLEIRDNHLRAIREHMGDSEWSRPAALKLARENLRSRVKEEDSITDVENAVFDFRVMNPLGFLIVDQRVLIGLIAKFI